MTWSWGRGPRRRAQACPRAPEGCLQARKRLERAPTAPQHSLASLTQNSTYIRTSARSIIAVPAGPQSPPPPLPPTAPRTQTAASMRKGPDGAAQAGQGTKDGDAAASAATSAPAQRPTILRKASSRRLKVLHALRRHDSLNSDAGEEEKPGAPAALHAPAVRQPRASRAPRSRPEPAIKYFPVDWAGKRGRWTADSAPPPGHRSRLVQRPLRGSWRAICARRTACTRSRR